MKKTLFIFLGLFCSATMWSYSYFSMGTRDTIWYNPNLAPNGKTVHVNAQMDARVDTWDITFTYPSSITPTSMVSAEDMLLTYVNNSNDTVTQWVTLYNNAPLFTTASASVSVSGYWYNPDNVFESYGTVKWEPGYYDRMFDIGLSFASGFSGGNISLLFHMSCSPDKRGNILAPLTDVRQVVVVLGNMRGDVNGDDLINAADVTALIAYTLGNITDWDQYQIAAADLNGDGYVNVADVTELIQLIVNN